jgi:hypothetical protein
VAGDSCNRWNERIYPVEGACAVVDPGGETQEPTAQLSGVTVPADAMLGAEGRALPLIEDAADYASGMHVKCPRMDTRCEP